MSNITQSAKRMNRLVNDLLNISRIESGGMKLERMPVQLEKVIQEIINDLAPLTNESGCQVLFEKPGTPLPRILVDVSLLREVLRNLIVNAVHYSFQDNCSIVVALQRKSKKISRPARVAGMPTSRDIGTKEQKDGILISVKDNGIGIPKDQQWRIFEKFFRADNAVKRVTDGSGLGLYIVKMITEAWGGEMWFESEKGKGSTFYATIPIGGMKAKAGRSSIAT